MKESISHRRVRSNSCLFCRRRKRRCNGGHPCSTCVKYGVGNACSYTDSQDGRKMKYDSAHVDYLELKSDILEQYARELIKKLPELKGFNLNTILPNPPKLGENNDPSQLKEIDTADQNALEEMVSTAWRVKSIGNKTAFYGPLSGKQSITSESLTSMADTSVEDNLMDISFASLQLRTQLFDIFERTFAYYFQVSMLALPEIRTWDFPSSDISKECLLCAIFCYASVYLPNRESLTSAFLKEAEALVIEACRQKLNTITLQALLILSCIESGLGNDSISWMYDGMCASQAQFLHLHERNGGKISSATEGMINVSPLKTSLFWSIILQDRFLTTSLGRGCRIQYFRITCPFYTPLITVDQCTNEQMRNRYITEVTFSLHSKLWYIHDRATQQIYSSKADYLHPSHYKILLEQGLSTLQTLYESFPEEFHVNQQTSDPRILLLNLSLQVVNLLLYRPYLVQNPKKVLNVMVIHCTAASQLVDQFIKSHGFEAPPYFVVYLVFQCSIFELFLLAHKNETIRNGASDRISIFIQALLSFKDIWPVACNDLAILKGLAQRWNVEFKLLDELNEDYLSTPNESQINTLEEAYFLYTDLNI